MPPPKLLTLDDGARSRLEEAATLGLSLRQAAAYARLDYATLAQHVGCDGTAIGADWRAWAASGCVRHAQRVAEGATGSDVSLRFLRSHDAEAWNEPTKVEHSGSLGLIGAIDAARRAIADGSEQATC